MATLSISNLTVRIGDPPREVLRGISFLADAGSLVLVLGANGSGKSVLLRTLLGFHRVKGGSILLDGRRIGHLGTREMRRRIGVTFQNTDVQIFGDTVASDLMIGHPEKRVIDDEIIGAFGLSGLEDQSPAELSGGQRRRLALAGAFLNRPDFLILDEPFIELDYPHILAVLREIDRARDRGATVIVASHETRDIWERTDTVILLNEGQVLGAGAPTEVASLVGPAVGLRPIGGDR